MVELNRDPKVHMDEEDITEGVIVTQGVWDGDILASTRLTVAVHMDKPQVGVTVGVKSDAWVKGQSPEMFEAAIPFVTSRMEDIRAIRDILDAVLTHYETLSTSE